MSGRNISTKTPDVCKCNKAYQRTDAYGRTYYVYCEQELGHGIERNFFGDLISCRGVDMTMGPNLGVPWWAPVEEPS